MTGSIIYEHPLNEVIRLCLRLEQLFERIDHQLKDTTQLGSRCVIASIIEALQLLDRPDLKAKLARELSYHLTNLSKYRNLPDIDEHKLKQLTHQLDELAHSLIENSKKIGHRLREIELLNVLRLHLNNPGGASSFDVPLYHYWLQQPAAVRQKIILDWLSDFEQIKTATTLALDLIRKHSKMEHKTAIHGFHQELLDPQTNLRMIRISIESTIPVYPEISVGRHFLSIRWFCADDIEKRPEQYIENIGFYLGYCLL
ncbi:MAG TPA: cell division protein ZapD [Gammaproteobacteria bacterium]|jgi:cell division protein ZapD|nr:cell division protein ZapD [Gammaproteobacteria bacterium]